MTSPVRSPPASRYMVSRGWDLMFIVNAPWVLVAGAHLLFLQGWLPDVDNLRYLYVTLPHRFITFALIFLDRQKLAERPATFIGLPIGFTLLVLAAGYLGTGVFLTADVFLCIFTIDYIWNAYHFAAQHYGITRIYARKAGGGRQRLERWILVPAVSWAMLRAANWSFGGGLGEAVFTGLDVCAAAGLLVLIGTEVRDGVPSTPKLAYLSSVGLLYGGMLLLPYVGLEHLRLGLLAATGYFHAMEYLGIVHFYVNGKRRGGGFRTGPFRMLAPVWTQAVVLFALGVGTLALVGLRHMPPWIFVVVLAAGSFSHYAYDGMIWKLRKPKVSRALGAEMSA